MAGESAEEVARDRERPQWLRRNSAANPGEAGGGRGTAEVLESLPEPWVVLHDLRWPGRQRRSIDHVAIGPTGVFVIDPKSWAAASAVARLVPSLQEEAFRPVLCLARDENLLTHTAGLTVCTTATLVSALTDRPVVLSSEWLEFLRFDLDMSTGGEAPARHRLKRLVSRCNRMDIVSAVVALLAAATIVVGVEHYAHAVAGRQLPAPRPVGVHDAARPPAPR